jgi:hypothetical protein
VSIYSPSRSLTLLLTETPHTAQLPVWPPFGPSDQRNVQARVALGVDCFARGVLQAEWFVERLWGGGICVHCAQASAAAEVSY